MSASILYVWLPVSKIYPLGITYLANYIHRRNPDISQHILDLSLIPRNLRKKKLRERIRAQNPGIVSFGWRDIQIFSPHEGHDSIKYAFNFYYSWNPVKKILSSFYGLKSLYQYYDNIHESLSYLWQVYREFPEKTRVIGGGAFNVFSEQVIHKLPEGTIGIVGEGEEALLKIAEGRDISDERTLVKKNGALQFGTQGRPVEFEEMEIDLPYLEAIFPQFTNYQHEVIGIQTKRGCPYECSFCVYPYIEGKGVRHRKPASILKDIRTFHDRWGTRHFWFTDAQFIPGSNSIPHVTNLLEGILQSGLNITWSGYIRTSLISGDLADLMVKSGLGDLEVAITSGDQEVLNGMKLGFRLDKLYEGVEALKKAGYQGKIILNYSLNSPGDTEKSLRVSVESYKQIADILGEERVVPVLFFLGIQPHTDLEAELIASGYLKKDYNPLSLNPFAVKKMLYNPAPLNKIIAKACFKAWSESSSQVNKTVVQENYADRFLKQAVEKNYGRAVFAALDQELPH
ncbi:MAG: radical SAM protein [Nitrospirae bacterium]|nr:radical SAM protein [Nitrospirota bacterium]